jgi:hypothetical protein
VLHRAALCLLTIALALLASSTLSPPVAAVGGTWVVDDDPSDCVDGSAPDYPTITQALAVATNDDTIRVCEGDYTETTLTINVSLIITGPGATPENDGVATIHHDGGSSALIEINADGVTLEGLDLDATPPSGWAFQTSGIDSSGDYVTIQDNEIRNATDWAVSAGGMPFPSNVNILRNNIHDNGPGGIGCNCDDSGLWSNTVDAGGGTALSLTGDRGTIGGNVVTNGTVTAFGNDMVVQNNQISAGTASSTLYVSGNPVTITNNSLSDATYYGIEAAAGVASSTSAIITNNTFTQINTPIYLWDWDPSDAFGLTATIGGSPSEANTFVNCGGTLGDLNYLVEMEGPTAVVNAEHNNWGLCTAAEIEQEIYHQVDDPAQGLVDFEPFIAPDTCAAPTPTPTVTPMPPAPGQMHNCPEPGKWSISTWSGQDAMPIADALAFCPQLVDAAYRIDPDTQAWTRYFRGRPEISNLSALDDGQGVIALGAGVSAASTTGDETLRAAVSGMLGCPHPGKWAISVWSGASETPTEQALATCPEATVATAYWLDPQTQSWKRYFQGRPDISNLTALDEMQGIITLGGEPVQAASSS